MRVLVAMSGGIDSSITAYLLKKQGYEVIGLTFINYIENKDDPQELQFVKDAQAIASFLDIKHVVINIEEDFKTIVNYFIDEYMAGRTPNPCVICNPTIKWHVLVEHADMFDARYIATGHYAILKEQNGRYFISQGKDTWKDQSYFLYRIPQDYLKRTIFPLGEYTKSEIKEIAAELGLHNLIQKRESYDVCFVKTEDYRHFILKYAKERKFEIKPGNFIDEQGKVVGTHSGIPFYTIGQRRGLGIALGYPAFVKEIRPETNEIVVAPKPKVTHTSLYANDYRLMKYADIQDGQQVTVRVRYKDKGTSARLYKEDGRIKVVFDKEVFGVTPGQSAVFYEGEDVVGGGIISLD